MRLSLGSVSIIKHVMIKQGSLLFLCPSTFLSLTSNKIKSTATTIMNSKALSLQYTTHNAVPAFPLFCSLPKELRLQIINHALPAHRTIHVYAEILAADPEFGLYIYFTHVTPLADNTPKYGYKPRLPADWYVSARALSLLSVNHEFRECYLEHFPCSLPTHSTVRRPGKGRIRFSPHELVDIRNLAKLVQDHDVVRAIAEKWTIQRFWNDIEQILVERNCDLLACANLLKAFRSMKIVKLTIQRAFISVGESTKVAWREDLQERGQYFLML